jgi:catechol 2,3-dioxygenase-like lactoylglutathione lyase family enzyme
MARLVSGLAEIVVWSHDIERSLGFYRDLLGLTVMDKQSEVKPTFLKVGDGAVGIPQMIVLVPHPDQGGSFPSDKPLRTLHHMAFALGAAEYDQLESDCRQAGIEVRGGIHPVLQGVRTFYIDDPDGNEVEIIGPAA